MKIALTGGTGFLGRYILRNLASAGHDVCAWYRPESDRSNFADVQEQVSWLPGELGSMAETEALVQDADAVVHSALYRPGTGVRGAEGDLQDFIKKNLLGSIALMQAAKAAGVPKFIFISTCAVHEIILDDRALDEAHPLWPMSHYGAHKAAIEKFVHSFGYAEDYDVCALRPTGIYGLAQPIERSKWFKLVQAVIRESSVEYSRGAKEVHAADVAKAVALLLESTETKGQAFNCYDCYVSEYEVAQLAKELSNSTVELRGAEKSPKHQIETGKLKALGMEFGGKELLRRTISELVEGINK